VEDLLLGEALLLEGVILNGMQDARISHMKTEIEISHSPVPERLRMTVMGSTRGMLMVMLLMRL